MIADYFRIDKNPKKGLLAFEWVILGYTILTFLIMLFTYTKLVNPEAMLWGRLRATIILVAMWGVYRGIPCRMTLLARVAVQLLMLSIWYPDTYEINRMFTNMDHVVATWEQTLCGFQPAIAFSKAMPWAWFSELVDFGYVFYYPMIGVVTILYFGWRYEEFERASFVILASFFIYYVIFIFFPVAGPTYYFNALDASDIAKGVFPEINDYFNSHLDCLPAPGYKNGIFWNLVEDARMAGERPTAAFPSSHVGISTVCMMLVLHSRNRKVLYALLPIYLLLCMATVYIQAHYLVDAIAGFFSGVVLYAFLMLISRGMSSVSNNMNKKKR